MEKPKNKVSDIKKFLEKKRLERDEKQKSFGAKIQKNSQFLNTKPSSDSCSAGKIIKTIPRIPELNDKGENISS